MTTPRTPFAAAAIALAVTAVLAGCAVQSDSTPTGEPVVTTEPAPTTTSAPAPAAKVRAPEATGTIVNVTFAGDALLIAFDPDAGYEYFAGTTFEAPSTAFPQGEDGVTLDPASLREGDHINVWVGVCAESSPVQCQVQRVELVQ